MESAVEDCWGMGTRVYEGHQFLTLFPLAPIPSVGGNVATSQAGPFGRKGLQNISDSGQGAALSFQLCELPYICAFCVVT